MFVRVSGCLEGAEYGLEKSRSDFRFRILDGKDSVIL